MVQFLRTHVRERLTNGPSTIIVAMTRGRSRGRAAVGLLREAWIEYVRDRARFFAIAIIYYAILSVVPILLLMLSALGLLLRYSATAVQIEQEVLLGIESRFGSQVSVAINGLLDGVQRSSISATVISVVGLIVSASLLFRQLRMTFRALWHYDPPVIAGPIRVRALNIVREWIIAFAITLGGGGLILLALVVIAAFRWVASLFDRLPLLPGSGGVIAVLTALVLSAITYGALLKVLPPRPVRWRDMWPAVLLCAAVWVAASEVLPLYHWLVGESRNAFNAIGALVPVLVLLNIGSQVLFYGAELCKVTTRKRSASVADVGERAA